ncbi:MAG: glycosyl transferase [Bosea sp. (in: a-proteobacteria)]
MVIPHALFVLGVSAALSALACWLLRPLLVRYALARPNVRSSHTVPTPQGGGIPILIAVILATLAGRALPASDEIHHIVAYGYPPVLVEIGIVLAAALMLGALGCFDDIRPLPALVRLVIQLAAVMAIVLSLPVFFVLPWPHFVKIPLWVQLLNLGILMFAGVWFVNLTNFMDGLDWLTVAGFVPLAAFVALQGVAIEGVLGLLGQAPTIIAVALCGALLGFAPFNRPVAKLFLGDVGALSIGLIGAYLLYSLAATAPGNISGSMTAAILLPLYHVMDATLTLLRRLFNGERVWEAHRTHAYQQATENGFSVTQVAGHVFGLNLLLCGLAVICMRFQTLTANIICLMIGIALTLGLIRHFTRKRAL